MLHFEKLPLPSFSSSIFTHLSLYQCQDFLIHRENSVNYSLYTQPTLYPKLKMIRNLAICILEKNHQHLKDPLFPLFFSQPNLKHVLCFGSLHPLSFFKSTGKKLAYFCYYKGLPSLLSIFQNFNWLLELYMAIIRFARPDHNYVCLSPHCLKMTACSILIICHLMSLL